MKKIYQPLQTLTLLFIFCSISVTVFSQTNPTPQSLPYSQNFSSLAAASTTFPVGWQGWNISAAGSGSSFKPDPPIADYPLQGGSFANTITEGVHNYNGKIGFLSGTTDASLCLSINTTGYASVGVNFNIATIRNPNNGSGNTRICQVDLQYRIGNSGNFISATGLANGIYQNISAVQIGGVTTAQNLQAKAIILPVACNNQSEVQIRWVQRDFTGGGTAFRPSFSVDDIVICTTHPTPTISISGPTAFCSADPTIYTAVITNGGTTPVYQWKKNGNIVGTNTNPVTLTGLSTGDLITCTLVSSATCLTSATANSNTLTIGTVGSSPSITLQNITHVTTCGGPSSGALDITVTGGVPPLTIMWDTINKTNGPNFGVNVGTKTAINTQPNIVGVDFYIDNVEIKELTLTRNILYNFAISGGHPFHISTALPGATTVGIVTQGQTGAPASFGTVTFKPDASHPNLLYYPCAAHNGMGWRINITNGYQTEDLNHLKVGTYTVVVKDANGCTATAQYTITNQPVAMNLSAIVNNAQCGNANGSINLNIAGGNGPFNVCWDTINTVNGNAFGVTSGPKTATNPYFNQGNPFCYFINGIEMPSLKLTRGIPYQFNVLAANHPFLISTDPIGGNTLGQVSSGQTGAPTTSGTVAFTPNNSHPGLLSYICGNHQYMGYSANIINGYCVEDPVGLKPGLYTVIVTDVLGCTATAQYTVGNQDATIEISGTVTDAQCGGTNGSVDIDINGGTGPYTVCWDTTNIVSGNIFNVTEGSKTASNPYFNQGNPTCFYLNAEEAPAIKLVRNIPYDFNVGAPGHPWHISTDPVGASTIGLVSSGQTGAPNDNGIVSFTPNNTHPSLLRYVCANHQYMGYDVNILNGYCVEDPTGLKPGLYTVIVTDANGCTATSQFSIGNVNSSLSLSGTINNATCSGGHNGSVDLDISGGTGPYSVCWDTINTSGNQFAVTFGAKTAAHPLFGQGSANGYKIDGVEGKELSLIRGLPYDFNVLTPNHPFRITTDLIGGTANNVVGNGQTGAPTTNGIVTFTPDQAHPSQLYYSCEFHPYMGYNVNIVNGYCVEDPINLGQGTYTVIVTDANGCTATTNFTINEPPAISLSAAITEASCTGARTGAIDLTVGGGTGPYTVCWDTLNTSGNQFGVTFGPKTAAHPLFGQGSANGYLIDGVEGKNLSFVKGITYSFNVLTPNHPFRITTDLAGGTANNVVANGQSGAPTTNGLVTFSPDNTHPAQLYYSCEFHQFMGGNADIVNGYCIEDLSNLKDGLYTVIVTDVNGCSATASYFVGQAPPVSLSATVTDATCSGTSTGSINLDISGGNGPYTTCWDTTNLLGSEFAVGFGPKSAAHPLFGQGSANGYIVDGVEGKEINLVRGISYTFNVFTPNHPFRITTDLQGGTANNVVSQGQVGAPTTNGIVNFTPDNSHPSQLYYSCEFHQYMGYNVNISSGYCIEDPANLRQGNYLVTVTDANGCTSTGSFFVNEPTPVSISTTVTDAICNLYNGAIDLDVSGGTGPYSVCWDTSNFVTGPDFAVSFGAKTAAHPLFGQGSANGYIIDNVEGKDLHLSRGIPYSFNVFAPNHPFRITTDLAGGTANNVVLLGQSGAPTTNGIINFNPDDSHPSLLYYSCEFHQFMGYNVNINNGYCVEDLTNLHYGNYSVIVEDANGCSMSSTFAVNQVTSAEICGNNIDDDCNGTIDDGCNTNSDLNVKLFIEGYYIGGGMMVASPDPMNYPTLCDTVTIQLADANSPYTILYSKTGTINTNGSGLFQFPQNLAGQSYYIVIRHRNSIETWSANPVLFGPVTTYDFTSAPTQAFGNNMSQTSDNMGWAIFSGDISSAVTASVGTQDGIVESQDYGDMENAVSITLIGYVTEDITGDGIVESSDYSLMENNVFFVIVMMRP